MLPQVIEVILNSSLAPFIAAVLGGAFTLFSIWWKHRVEKSKPRSELRLTEIELLNKTEREFRIMISAELDKCKTESAALRVENISKDKTIIDLTRQLAVAQLDSERFERARKIQSKT